MAAELKQKWTVEAYFALERESEVKHEYIDGEVVAMVGASANHNLITASTIAALYVQLRGRSCAVYPSDMRVRINKTHYTYPDITVVCGTAEYDREKLDTLLNPTLIIEVLSPSTELYDRGEKFRQYRTLPSLQEYVLITQTSARIEAFRRTNQNEWVFTDAIGLDAAIELRSIECPLLLKEVYERVTFEE